MGVFIENVERNDGIWSRVWWRLPLFPKSINKIPILVTVTTSLQANVDLHIIT